MLLAGSKCTHKELGRGPWRRGGAAIALASTRRDASWVCLQARDTSRVTCRPATRLHLVGSGATDPLRAFSLGAGRGSRLGNVECSPDKPMLESVDQFVAREAGGYKADCFSRAGVFCQ